MMLGFLVLLAVLSLLGGLAYRRLWIGQADGLVHQQNVVLTLPEQTVNKTTIPQTQLTSLITYYDIDDPGITIEPPIQ